MLLNIAKALMLVVAVSAAPVASAQTSWADLPDPAAQSYEDPFLDLSVDDIENLVRIVRLEDRLYLPETSTEARKRYSEELADLKAAFSDRGMDAGWLISQRWEVAALREKAATAGNPAVDGTHVSLSGYAIPAATGAGPQFAYLVPERGMCSHTPPPHPNQMIRLRLNADWQPSAVHEPVRVTGAIRIAPSRQRMMVVDGMVAMNATFDLEVEQVETVAGPAKEATAAQDWISNLRNQLRQGRQAAPDG